MAITDSRLIIVGTVLVVGALFAFLMFSPGERPQRAVVSGEAASVNIIAFGDSLTAGYDLPVSESYPSQLEAQLKSRGVSARVINAGVSGETTRGNLERARFIRDQNPDIVLLGIGGNDALRALPVEETENNIADTIETLQSGDNPPTVILLGMQAPLLGGLAYKRQFDALYSQLAEKYDLTLAPFVTAKVFLNAQYTLPDRIHLNKEGYALVVRESILPAVEDAIEQRAR